jgi:hypothetical protein
MLTYFKGYKRASGELSSTRIQQDIFFSGIDAWARQTGVCFMVEGSLSASQKRDFVDAHSPHKNSAYHPGNSMSLSQVMQNLT